MCCVNDVSIKGGDLSLLILVLDTLSLTSHQVLNMTCIIKATQTSSSGWQFTLEKGKSAFNTYKFPFKDDQNKSCVNDVRLSVSQGEPEFVDPCFRTPNIKHDMYYQAAQLPPLVDSVPCLYTIILNYPGSSLILVCSITGPHRSPPVSGHG